MELSLFTINFAASTFWANSTAGPEGSFEGGMSTPGIPASRVRACCLLMLSLAVLLWPLQCGVATISQQKSPISLITTDLKNSWESVLLCGNSGEGSAFGNCLVQC